MRNIIGAFVVCAMLGGCGWVKPDRAFVEASDSIYKAIGPEYGQYVEEDDTLDDDQKEDRRQTLRAWARMNEEALASIGD